MDRKHCGVGEPGGRARGKKKENYVLILVILYAIKKRKRVG